MSDSLLERMLTAAASLTSHVASFTAAPLEYDISVNPLRDDILGDRLAPDKTGCVPVPTGPGLGVTVNEDLLKQYVVAQR